MYGCQLGKKGCLSSYMMDALNQYYYCFKGKSAQIHTDDVICQQNKFYIWQDADIFKKGYISSIVERGTTNISAWQLSEVRSCTI